jgi:hypothetical protein
MSQQPPSEMLNSQLLATIERQRRIICDLLLKNEALRRRLTHTGKNAGESQEQESARRRLEPGRQTRQFGEMRMHGRNDLQVARSAKVIRAAKQILPDA